LRCLDAPIAKSEVITFNWNKRLGTGQDLGRLV
jgi:hypothetical protein